MDIFLYTFVPSIVGLGLIYLLDKNREPLSTILTVLFAGFLLCLPAGLLNTYFPPLIGLSDEDAFIAGFTEEPLKFLAFLMFVKSREEFNEPMDAVVYGAMLSIGFATFENFEYVYIYEFDVDPLTVAMFRACTAVPLHICCGIIMGYFIALGYHKPTAFFYLRAVSVPAFLHATYNFIDEVVPTFMFMLFIVGLTISFHKKVRKAQIKLT